MKGFRFASVLLLGMVTIWGASCKKNNDNTKSSAGSSVTGYWFGSAYGGQFNQSFLIKANGTLKVYDFYYYPTSTDTTKAYDGTGTYTVNGNTITINTAFPNGQTFTGTATLNLTTNPQTITFDNSHNGYANDVYKKQ